MHRENIRGRGRGMRRRIELIPTPLDPNAVS
jgi:hypothetical protein